MANLRQQQFIGAVKVDTRRVLLAVNDISSIEESDTGTTVIMKSGAEYELENTIADFDFHLNDNISVIIKTDCYKR